MVLTNTHWVSPTIKKCDLTFPLSLDDKIRVFEDRVLGWQLRIADELYSGVEDAGGNRIPSLIKHNGFAVLYIILSYFEMIPKFEAGNFSEVSGIWFKRGVMAVLPEVAGNPDEISILSGMWKGARNGLYHSAMTKKNVFISGEANCLDYDQANKQLTINPGALARRSIVHFKDYIARVRNPANVTLRKNFEAKFDKEIGAQII